MMKRESNLTIKTQLYLFLFVPASVCALFYIFVVTVYDYRTHEDDLEKQLLHYSKILSDLTILYISENRYDILKNTFNNFAKKETNIKIYLNITNDKLQKEFIDFQIGPDKPVKFPEEGYYYQYDKIWYITPLKPYIDGFLCINMPTRIIHLHVLNKLFIIVTLTFILSCVLFFLIRNIGTSLVNQIEKISEFLNTVLRTKNFSKKINFGTTDEIGILSFHIDLLLEEIHKQFEALSSLQKSLQEQILIQQQNLEKEKYLREKTEKNLQREESRFETLVQNVNSIILRMQPDGTITFINRYGENFFMYRPGELLGQNVIGTIVPITDSNQRNLREMILDIGKNPQKYIRNENENMRKNGERVWISWSNKAIYDDEGKIIEILCVGNDLTEHRRMEQEVLRAKELLEQKNKELTATIEQANRLAMKAEIASQSKTLFLANMSHEIRTPLNGIIGVLHLLKETEVNEQNQNLIQMALHNSEALLSLLNDLLDFAQIEKGTIPLRNEPFSPEEVVENIIQMFWQRAHEKQIEIGCLMSKNLPSRVMGDGSKVRQILINLVGNAIKFTEQGEVCVQVKPIQVNDKSVLIRFEVIDTGLGIVNGEEDKIFLAFEQGSTKTQKKYEGTGLGLAISKQLVELMNGKIGVSKNESGGTTFWFEIEFALAPSDKDESFFPLQKHLWLISKNKSIKNTIEQITSSWRVELTTWETVQELLEFYDEQRDKAEFSKQNTAILFDIDAYEENKTNIQSLLHISDIPKIIIYTADKQYSQTLNTQFKDCLQILYPIRKKDLLEALNSTVKMERLKREEAYQTVETSGKGKILVAEDNSINQKVILEFLSRRGYQVDLVDNGNDVLTKYKNNKYDLILMDVELPGINGLETTKRIREEEQKTGHHTPIIALTAYAFEEYKSRCLESGMDGYLVKPLSPESLVETVKRFMNTSQEDRIGVVSAEFKDTSDFIPVFDEDSVLHRIDNDMELFFTVIKMFFQTCPKYIQQTQVAIDNEDLINFHKAVHTLRGSLANVGAMKAERIAKVLEQKSCEGNKIDWDNLSSLFQDLCKAIEEFKEVLSKRFPDIV